MTAATTFCILGTEHFTYSKESRRFVIEDSTLLGLGFRQRTPTAALTLKSAKTGALKSFLPHKVRFTGREYNEVEVWIYRSADGIEIHVLND